MYNIRYTMCLYVMLCILHSITLLGLRSQTLTPGNCFLFVFMNSLMMAIYFSRNM